MAPVSMASADECITVDKYSASISSHGIKLFASNAAATDKMEALFNKNRNRDRKPSIEASLFLVGFITNKNGDMAALVAIFDKNGCVIEPTISLLSIRQWVDFTIVAGVTAKDFSPIEGA